LDQPPLPTAADGASACLLRRPQAQIPDGRWIQLNVPDKAAPGTVLHVRVPPLNPPTTMPQQQQMFQQQQAMGGAAAQVAAKAAEDDQKAAAEAAAAASGCAEAERTLAEAERAQKAAEDQATRDRAAASTATSAASTSGALRPAAAGRGGKAPGGGGGGASSGVAGIVQAAQQAAMPQTKERATTRPTASTAARCDPVGPPTVHGSPSNLNLMSEVWSDLRVSGTRALLFRRPSFISYISPVCDVAFTLGGRFQKFGMMCCL